MLFLPFDKSIYITRLTKDEALERLSDQLALKELFKIADNSPKPYEGYIEGYTFRFNTTNNGRKSIPYYFKGTVEDNFPGTRIAVKMRWPVYGLIFLTSWVSVFLAGGFFLLWDFLLQNSEISWMTLLQFGIATFGYSAFMLDFNLESRKARKYLTKLFEAREVRDTVKS